MAAVVLFVVGVLVIALIGLGRFSGDIDPARVPAWFIYYRHDPEVRRWLAIGAGVMALFLLILATAVALGIRRPLHGAARWSTRAEQRRHRLRARTGILLGETSDGLLVADGPDHLLLYAPTRTGKGVGVVIPNLLAWPSSVVVLDIKRENFNATAGFRAGAGQTVHLFDPLAPDGRTARFNPLGHIDRSEPVVVLDELQRIANMLFPAHSHADPFWAEAARTGFIGVGAYVAATPDLPFTLGEIYRQLTDGDPRDRLPKLLEQRRKEGDPLPAGAVTALNDFCSSGENTFASIRQSITTRMGLWLNPLVDAATSHSDFDLRAIRSGRLSLYLAASPENMDRVAPLYALLFQQLVDLNSRALPDASDPQTLVLLDEFARLGRAPVLAHAFAWVASAAGHPEPLPTPGALWSRRDRGHSHQLRAGDRLRAQGAQGGAGAERTARLLHLPRAQPQPTDGTGAGPAKSHRFRSEARSHAAAGADAVPATHPDRAEGGPCSDARTQARLLLGPPLHRQAAPTARCADRARAAAFDSDRPTNNDVVRWGDRHGFRQHRSPLRHRGPDASTARRLREGRAGVARSGGHHSGRRTPFAGT